jgi:arylsulfatase A-like enzyme
MRRREFIKAAGIFAGGAFANQLAPGKGFRTGAFAPDKRPNILFIMTDQQSADVLSCRMGTAHLKTPVMDSLAAKGMFFRRAYTANPLCIPARTSLFTGQCPHTTGIQTNDNKASLGGRFQTFGNILRDAGYDTGYFGKWHLPYPANEMSAHGFEVMGAVKNDGIDSQIPPLAGEFILQKRDNPFLLVTSFVNPHNICEWARGEELKNGAVGDPPPEEQCPPAVKNSAAMKDEPDILPLIRRSYQSAKMFPVGSFDKKKWCEYRWAYFRMIEMVDSHIGKVLQAVQESGQAENTLVVFTADHGDCQGAHGWNQKTVLFEESVRVPLIISSQGSSKAGTSNLLVNTGLDLFPTLCDYAGVKPPANLSGMSLKAAAGGAAAPSRPYVVVENKMIQGVPIEGDKPEPGGRMVRSERFKYCLYDLGQRRESLVAMEQDPGELVNLAGKEEYREALKQHRQYLAEWCRTTQDTFLSPEHGSPVISVAPAFQSAALAQDSRLKPVAE